MSLQTNKYCKYCLIALNAKHFEILAFLTVLLVRFDDFMYSNALLNPNSRIILDKT